MVKQGEPAPAAAHGDGADAPVAGIVGLGLIGGSFARAYHEAGWRVLALDPDEEVMDVARVDVVQGVLGESNLTSCRIIVLAAYPAACLDWLDANASALGACSDPSQGIGPVVIDAAGVKRAVCERAFAIAREHGFAFCGAHPMAGTQFSGYAASRADLFRGAPMVLVPPTDATDTERLDLLDRVHTALVPVGFGSFSVTTPEDHDRMIAFTSQLAHVVSNAYVKSPTARGHQGFSAGSYRDLTRVAHLNPSMWSELMMDDADNLASELTGLIGALTDYRDALAARDRPRLEKLLAEGDRIKRALDDASGQGV